MHTIIIPASVIRGFSDIANIAGVYTSVKTCGLPGLFLVARFKQRNKKQITFSNINDEPPNDDIQNDLLPSLLPKNLQNFLKRFQSCIEFGLGELFLGITFLLLFVIVIICGSISTTNGIVN